MVDRLDLEKRRMSARIDAFRDLDGDTVSRFVERFEKRHVPRGDTLIRQGETARELYLVLSGRFAVFAGDTPIAEIGQGETIGELAFFLAGQRTATVIAARDSEVLVLSQAAYETLLHDLPGLERSILRSVAARLAKVTSTSPKLRPAPGTLVAVVAADGGALGTAFCDSLQEALSKIAGWSVARLSDCRAMSEEARKAWLCQLEASAAHTAILCDHSEGVTGVARDSDTLFLVEPIPGNDGSTPRPLCAFERTVFANTMPKHLHRVHLRNRPETPIRDTARWLETRNVALCHHVAMGSERDFARLARFISGTALGVVLCGGGAFGAAHLGVIMAMQDHGVEVDMIGGTSVGAALGAALAMGYAPDEAMEICDDIFVKSKAMGKWTFPLHSVVDQRPLDQALQRAYRGLNIEDLPIPFFAAATSLTHNDLHVARSGPVWRAVRGSSAIPAIFPPMVQPDGEVLTDGALIDNVPIAVMRDLKAGPNLVLNIKQGRTWRVSAQYEDLPSRLGALRRLIWRRKSDPRLPSIASVLTRSMIVSSKRQLATTPMDGDILLEVASPKGMGFLDWAKGRRLFQSAHESMSAAMAQAADVSDDRMERLRVASMTLDQRPGEGVP